MTVTVCYRLLYYRVTDLVTVQEIDNNLVETERRLGRTTSTICTLGGLARWVGFLGTWLLGCPVRRPYPNPQVTLFIRDRLKALKAVQVFDHSPRATPCRKLEVERGYCELLTVTTPGERHRTAPSTTALHILATCTGTSCFSSSSGSHLQKDFARRLL